MLHVIYNKFSMFRALYLGHFILDFQARVTLKGKAVATECVFQDYSQLLDICTWLVVGKKSSDHIENGFTLMNILVKI